ncbi:MAG: hypothetical protein IKP73_01625 [Bacteroidales bacterium]|nr:hypothetical protein [Bacteroidales bacterium]
MMGRENFYDDDVDTMTEETEDMALNPDYDRVSGSGEMPSLDDFLGVNHSSDGLGASSDPFGNVIGDPVYAGVGYAAGGEEGYGYGVDAEDNDSVDSDTDDEEVEPELQNVRFSMRTVMDGTYFRGSQFAKLYSFIALFIVLAVLHVANRNNSEGFMREERDLKQEVREYRAESVIITANLMGMSKVTEVSSLVKKRQLKIRAVQKPPMQFVIDKFIREDSLTQELVELQGVPSAYDADYGYSPKN